MLGYWFLCCGVTTQVCLCACVLLLFIRKADKTRFIVNRSIYNRCIMALQLCLNSKGWLNVTRTLFRADYIGYSVFEVRLLTCG